MTRSNSAVPPHDSADDRTMMAEERTFSAWVRSGLASVGAALAIAKVLPPTNPAWIGQLLGVLLAIAGAMAFVFGYWGYRRGSRNWSRALPRAIPAWFIGAFTGLLLLAAVLALYLILFDA